LTEKDTLFKGMKLKAIIHQAEEGGYWAEVPALPGCLTEGENLDDVQANLKEAIEGWLLAGNENDPSEPGQVLELAA
jgi:predicted RNase H-like HicB family nuclease